MITYNYIKKFVEREFPNMSPDYIKFTAIDKENVVAAEILTMLSHDITDNWGI